MARQRRYSRDSRLTALLGGICVMLFIFSLAVVLTLNSKWLYHLDIKWLHVEAYSGLSETVIRRNYDALIAYNSLLNRNALIFPDLPMSSQGAIHFADVKRIFDLVQILAIVTGIGTLVTVWRMRWRSKGYLKVAGIGTLLVPVVLGVTAALNWERFFIGFHELVFSNDYWLFDPVTDPVIRILPEAYFMHCAILIGVIVVLGSLICLRFSRRYR